jgi:hypothetical protein
LLWHSTSVKCSHITVYTVKFNFNPLSKNNLFLLLCHWTLLYELQKHSLIDLNTPAI